MLLELTKHWHAADSLPETLDQNLMTVPSARLHLLNLHRDMDSLRACNFVYH